MTKVHELKLQSFDARAAEPEAPMQPAPTDSSTAEQAEPDIEPNNTQHALASACVAELEKELREATLERAREAELLKNAAQEFLSARNRLDEDLKKRLAEEVGRACSLLLPKCAEAFLAEEVARQLSELTMTPGGPLRLQVGDPKLIESLKAALDELALEPGSIEFLENAELDSLRVEVDWQVGGIDFEFDHLIRELCSPPHNQGEETTEPGDQDG